MVQICSRHRQEPVQQVEWYPTQAALHKAYERYVTVGGYKKEWLFESTARPAGIDTRAAASGRSGAAEGVAASASGPGSG